MMWSGNLLNNISSLLSFLIVCFSFHVFLYWKILKKVMNVRLFFKKRSDYFPPLKKSKSKATCKGANIAQVWDRFVQNVSILFLNFLSQLGLKSEVGIWQKLIPLPYTFYLPTIYSKLPSKMLLFLRKYLPLLHALPEKRWLTCLS